MANILHVPDTDYHYITWRISNTPPDRKINFTLRDKDGNPIAKAKLSADQLHRFICMNNTMK